MRHKISAPNNPFLYFQISKIFNMVAIFGGELIKTGIQSSLFKDSLKTLFPVPVGWREEKEEERFNLVSVFVLSNH